MAKARQKPSGKWEVALRHPSLPGGRRYYLFDTEGEANNYYEQWKLMKLAGLPLPPEMLKPAAPASKTLGALVREFSNSGLAADSMHSALGSLMSEVGAVQLKDATYSWLANYVQSLKVEKNLSPSSIRHRVQALGRCIDEFLRHNPDVVFSNPVRLLPKGYSTYNDVDTKLVRAAGNKVKVDQVRERRLHPGEEDRILAVLSGHVREDRERGLELLGGNALKTMFLLIVNTGLRLKEAYTLKRGQVDLDAKVIRVQSSKQWRGKVAFRDVPMPPPAHAALVDYLATRQMLPAALLFPFMEEEPDLPITKVSQRLSFRYKTAFEYSDCLNLREHDLRHEATCRWLEMRGGDGNWLFRLEEVNRIMGWSTNSTMAQRYASFRGVDLAQRMWVKPNSAQAA